MIQHPLNHPLFQKLISYNLPTKDWALFGSAILYIHGLKELNHDIDIIARGQAWELSTQIKDPQQTDYKQGLVVKLEDDQIEIYNEWVPGKWDIDKLIDEADTVDDIRIVGFEEVIKFKTLLNREKDLIHLALIHDYINAALKTRC